MDRPLALGEVLAETVRLYGDRIWATLGLGVVTAVAFLASLTVHPVIAVGIVSLAFTGTYAAATRVVAGDAFGEAWAQVAVRAPVLLVLTLVASLPFALALSQLVLFLFAVAWLAISGFSIPVSVLERDTDDGWFGRLAFSLRRSVDLARTEFFHAAGVIAALVLVYVLFGFVLGGTLVSFAENGRLAAVTLVQLVLAPFFFLGLSVLYFEQRARALSSPGRT